ncbi:hypothetical protein V6N12_065101 [Hibiscus sabdariffa]|uniref:Uncharacterized protein n=1 Tax=Hibiscus sabdariffa TaxID=183260 RepID=A0ABR2G827_9ROSI
MLRLDGNHVSNYHQNQNDERKLTIYITRMTEAPDGQINDLLAQAGFGHVSRIINGSRLDRCGVPVDGDPLTGVAEGDWSAFCYHYLRLIPDRLDGGRVHLNWLEENFAIVPPNAPQEILEGDVQRNPPWQVFDGRLLDAVAVLGMVPDVVSETGSKKSYSI